MADDGVLSVGREAICAGAVDKPVKEVVPPGRYWPGGEVMLTVEAATAAAPEGTLLVCGAIGVAAAGVACGWENWVTLVAAIAAVGAACIGDAAGSASA